MVVVVEVEVEVEEVVEVEVVEVVVVVEVEECLEVEEWVEVVEVEEVESAWPVGLQHPVVAHVFEGVLLSGDGEGTPFPRRKAPIA